MGPSELDIIPHLCNFTHDAGMLCSFFFCCRDRLSHSGKLTEESLLGSWFQRVRVYHSGKTQQPTKRKQECRHISCKHKHSENCRRGEAPSQTDFFKQGCTSPQPPRQSLQQGTKCSDACVKHLSFKPPCMCFVLGAP